MFVKLALNTITVLTLAVGLISCDRNEQVNSELGREENSAVNTSSTATGVAKEADVKVSQQQLYADGLGEKGTDAQTYEKMLIANTKAIVEGLGGEYRGFK